MRLDAEKRLQVIRMTISCLIVYFINRYYDTPERGWALVSVIFVMFDFTTATEVFHKSIWRFTGTAMSAIYGILIIYCCADNIFFNLAAFVLGMFFYAYYFMDQENDYIALIGMVTLTIVLLNPHEIRLALLRSFNVTIGIFVSMCMMGFFYPQYAKDYIFKCHKNFIVLLLNYIDHYLNDTRSLGLIKGDYLQYELTNHNNVFLFQKYLAESKKELPSDPLFTTLHQDVFIGFLNIFRMLNTLLFHSRSEQIRNTSSVKMSLTQIHNQLQQMKDRIDYQPNHQPILQLTNITWPHQAPGKKTVFAIEREINTINLKINQLIAIQNTWRSS